MNYLAHAFLSFNQAEILAGNMISDNVKGRAKLKYPAGIQRGIHLHRMIDNFTDFHPATAKAKMFFRPQYRLYSGAFVDIVYDHFLALDDKQFASYNGLKKFTENTYLQLNQFKDLFPPAFEYMFPFMCQQNWLYHYHQREGIRKAFGGLVRRAAYLSESEVAYEIFNENYSGLQECYNQFFPELKKFAMESLSNLTRE